jgi:hypothetical protein
MSILQGYGASNMSTDGIESLLKITDLFTGNVSKRITPWGKLYKYGLKPLSQLSGLPVANLSRDVVAIWNNTVGQINQDMWLAKYDSIAMTDDMKAGYETYVEGTGISASQYKSILEKANTDGNTSVKQDELGEYLVAEIEAGNLTEEQAQALWKSQWNKEKSKTFDKWRGTETKEEPKEEEPKGTTKTTAKTAAKTTTQKPAATPKPEEPKTIDNYDSFSKAAPLYGKEKKAASYNVWANYLAQTMSLDRFTQILDAADTDRNGSLKQNELGWGLVNAVKNREMSQEVASMIWDAQGWSHNFNYWLNRNYA